MKILPKPMHVALTALLCALACHSVSAQPIDCVQITDARERLACYDEHFKHGTTDTDSDTESDEAMDAAEQGVAASADEK